MHYDIPTYRHNNSSLTLKKSDSEKLECSFYADAGQFYCNSESGGCHIRSYFLCLSASITASITENNKQPIHFRGPSSLVESVFVWYFLSIILTEDVK